MTRFHRLFPLALAILMGMLTIWLDEITRPARHNQVVRNDRPEYQVEGFNAKRYTVTGTVSEQLIAEHAWKFPSNPELYSKNATLNVYDQGKLSYNVVGETARYNPQTRIVVFERQVDLFQPATAKRQAAHAHTSAMTVNAENHTAASQAPVRIDYGKSTASGVGFTYDQRSSVFQLLSHAKATYVP
jgi:lipopolysaccharide export system protein LptC